MSELLHVRQSALKLQGSLLHREAESAGIKGETLNRLLSVFMLTFAAVAVCSATTVSAPELDPGTGSAALTALAGAALIVRARARR